ncbi:hypothetical protein [Microcoleus sp. AT13-A5]|uniref:hypothetical protein n=1 Tax=Microcoleus sp. AT13-A5 TaxID=2818590 RepID=UPI002FD3F15D
MPVPQNQGATGILPVANNLEQARCLFHNQAISCATGILPVANNLEQARCLFHSQAISCATGILPVPKWHNIYPDE